MNLKRIAPIAAIVAIGIYYAFSRYGLVGSPIGPLFAVACQIGLGHSDSR